MHNRLVFRLSQLKESARILKKDVSDFLDRGFMPDTTCTQKDVSGAKIDESEESGVHLRI